MSASLCTFALSTLTLLSGANDSSLSTDLATQLNLRDLQQLELRLNGTPLASPTTLDLSPATLADLTLLRTRELGLSGLTLTGLRTPRL